MQNPGKTSEPEHKSAEKLESFLTHRYQSSQPYSAADTIVCEAVRKESGPSKFSQLKLVTHMRCSKKLKKTESKIMLKKWNLTQS